jgi:hypothetical protein
MNDKKLNVRTRTITVGDPSLVQLREEVRAKLPVPHAPGAMGPEAARRALVEAIQSLPDSELLNFRGGQIVIAM